jgi:hypothetical protein
MLLNISLTGDQLMITTGGPRKPLTPLSDAKFADEGGVTFEFYKDDKGEVTHLIARIVEGDIKAVRKK